jgi:hypothetical protein
MVSSLKPDACHKADKNRVEYGSTNVSIFRDRTISSLIVAILATALGRHHVHPLRGLTQEAVFLGTVGLTGAGAAPAVKPVFRLDATKSGPPPAPTADAFCAVRATYSAWLSVEWPSITSVAFVRSSQLETGIEIFVFV